jgi:diphosphomevalonate decarboxylase
MEFKARYTCPSNIAIVKYWGKYGNQLPKNASLSFTLSNAISDTKISLIPSENRGLKFLFEGVEKPSFLPKIEKFFNNINDHFTFLNDYTFEIESSNSFPHSSGIASSASGMAAMAMCLCDIESQINVTDIDLQKASVIARLGSGSACRSIYPNLVMWGKHDAYSGSSNDFAVPAYEEVAEVFLDYHDDILIVSADEKSVSSTAGHGLMNGNVYAESRYAQANEHMMRLKSILQEGDVFAFGELAELEAMTLHALMMCSQPSYILLQPDTLNVIKAIRQFRQDTQLPLFFTLDAGPNIHILYPHSIAEKVYDFINNDLLVYSPQKLIIHDRVGSGPKKILS